MFGGAKQDRTADLYNAIVALYQLSYDPSLCERNIRMIALTRQSLNSIKSHYLHHFSAILVIHLVFPKLLILSCLVHQQVLRRGVNEQRLNLGQV